MKPADEMPAEIEITPEMIEAGLLHLSRYDPEYGVDGEDTVKRIFLAMLGEFSWRHTRGDEGRLP